MLLFKSLKKTERGPLTFRVLSEAFGTEKKGMSLINTKTQNRDKTDKEKDRCNTTGCIPQKGLESRLQIMPISSSLPHTNVEATVTIFLGKKGK